MGVPALSPVVQHTGSVLDLTPKQIAAATFVGVRFLRATPDQVRRFTMQQKVFRIAGEAVLATRDGRFFETAATPQRLIAEGERQHQDLAQWATTIADDAPPALLSAPLEDKAAAASATIPAMAAEPSQAPRLAEMVSGPAPRRGPKALPRGKRWPRASAQRCGRPAQHWSAPHSG